MFLLPRLDVEPVASARSDARASNPVRGPRCSFCFCERRLLTWPAACKTCLDYGYTCLGYNEPAQSQSQPQTPSQPPARISQPAHVEDDGENNNRNARATPIRSPGTPQATLPPPPPPPTGNNNQSPNSPKSSKPPDASESKVVPLTKDTLAKANKEQGNAAGESPESSKFGDGQFLMRLRMLMEWHPSSRSHVSQLQSSHPCPVFQVLWSDGHRPGL